MQKSFFSNLDDEQKAKVFEWFFHVSQGFAGGKYASVEMRQLFQEALRQFEEACEGCRISELCLLTPAEINLYRQHGFQVEVINRRPLISPVQAEGRTQDAGWPTDAEPAADSTGLVQVPENRPLRKIAQVADADEPDPCPPEPDEHRLLGGLGRRPRPTRRELEERLLVLVSRLVEDAKEADLIRKMLAEWDGDDEPFRLDSGLFKPYVDDKKLAASLRSVYDCYYGPLPTNSFLGVYRKDIDLAAYLYILMEREHLGNDTFSEKGKKPFYDYLVKEAHISFSMTRRSYSDRIANNMGDFRTRLLNEPEQSEFRGSRWKHDLFIKDFLQVVEIFHATAYYKELVKRRREAERHRR